MNVWVPVKISVGFDGGEYLAVAKVQDYSENDTHVHVIDCPSFPTEEECNAYVTAHNKDMWDKMNNIRYEEGKFKSTGEVEVDNTVELRFKQLVKEGYVVDDFDLAILKKFKPYNQDFHIKRIKTKYRKG